MRKKYLLKTTLFALLSAAIIPLRSDAQTAAANQISLNDLSAFKNPPENWSVAGSVKADFNKANALEKKNGTGILVNITDKKKNEDIFTNFEHGDIDLSVDFMLPKGSNSGIYLQGRYEIQLFDSWGAQKLTSSDLGGIYQRWDDSKPEAEKGYEGVAPRINVSRAPGLWQNIRIVFQAPKFDASGKKTANARIVKIVLNGVSIIENAELQGPTRGSAFPNEAATGPLRIQGDHGSVAFKNFKYSSTVTTKTTDGTKQREWWDADRPVYVKVGTEPELLRSFVDIPGKRVTHAVNVGYPHNISYSFDMDNGALFQVWKGGFVDGTPMWNFRGDGNTTAIGSKLFFNDAPALATLANEGAAWPDTVATGSFRPKGYELDDKGYPTFKYTLNGFTVDDKITNDDGKTLTRTLSISGTGKAYVRAAAGSDIVEAGDGLYSVNGYEYYVQVAKDAKAIIRNSSKGKELLIPVKDADKGASVKYSLIW
ncbi:DUF1080 domain-containing protein [Mucilaginibacter limnophilus]|uniref:DUF1080 domain-containing protein n=1 Tax=Mucilaginibacter limnophilus TaxID=1932778 RepID=A0A3S2UNH2_9SPHI|nr:DUF1080 domain-containing protein [Mucilaginibacter limnophilus]RVU02057.1 DUF1080 domain-containing protein [Mucilaginibacter limnophilus]